MTNMMKAGSAAGWLLIVILYLAFTTSGSSSLKEESEDTPYTCDQYPDRPEFKSTCCPSGSGISCREIHYVLLAVSGTLEEGFELRENLDYRPHANSNVGRVNATFLGKALVRGYKSFLDIKNPTWREYKAEENRLKTVNPAVVPTGCDEHANRYAIYAVDARQALNALAGEPRFLSIAPDMGLVDLTASEEFTWPEIKKLSLAYSQRLALSGIEHPDLDRIAFLTVTSTWFKSTFVENGILYNDSEDSITDYPESTGIWSKGILNEHGPHESYPEGCGSSPKGGQVAGVDSAGDYNICIDTAIRLQEAAYSVDEDGNQIGPFESLEACPMNRNCLFECRIKARYGTAPNTVRFNKVLEACELETIMVEAGLVDDRTGNPKYPLQGCSLGYPSHTKDPFLPQRVKRKKDIKVSTESNRHPLFGRITIRKGSILSIETICALMLGFLLGVLVG
jgi:hypothetical protein